MKTFIKRFLLVAALSLWASAATAHHIAGSVLCTDTSPPTPLAGVEVRVDGAFSDGFTYTQPDGTFYINVASMSDTFTVTIVTPAGLTITSPVGGQYVVQIFGGGVGGPDYFDAANFALTGCAPPPPLGQIGDTVYCDANGNGIQDAGEAGIPGVTVNRVCRDDSGAIIATATAVTDANGKYLFVNVPAGSCTVTVDGSTVPPPCNNPGVCPPSVDHSMGPGEIFLDADFCFRPPALGSIGDTVYCDTNGNGVQDAGEPGIPGVRVTLVCRDAAGNIIASATAITDANGKYLFVNVPAGSCTVTVDGSTVPPPCNNPGVCAPSVDHVLGPGEIFLDADFCFRPPALGSIGDTVYCDTNGNGVQDAGEPGIPGVRVTLVCRDAAGNIIASATAITDANGKYLFVNVPAGSCTVTVDGSTVPPPCNNPGVCAPSVDHVLGAGEIFLDADFCFTPPEVCVSLFDDYLIIGMRPKSNGEAVTIGSSQEIGANRQTLSGDNPSERFVSAVMPAITPAYPAPFSPDLRDVFFKDPSVPTKPSKNRWLWDAADYTHYLPGAAKLFRGVDWSGEVAVTSPSGTFSLQDVNVFATFGFRTRYNRAPVNVQNSHFFAQNSLSGVLMDPIEVGGTSQPARGWIGGYDHDPLLAELRDLRTFIRILPKDVDFHSGNSSNPRDLVNRNTINAGGALTGPNTKLVYDLNTLDVNGDGFAVIDIQSDGTDFEVNNSDWIITDSNPANGTPFAIFRIRGKANMNMSQSSIIAGEGVSGSFSGLVAAFVKVHPDEEFTSSSGSSDSVFTANNLVINRIGFWDLNTIGDAPTDTDYDRYVNRNQQNNYTTLSVNNGQGCGQFISGQVYLQNVRFVRCAECIP